MSGQMQDAVVAAEVGKAKVLLYDELNAKAEKLVSGAICICVCGDHIWGG